MARQKTAYVCNDCGADYSKWQGQCTACNAWNTLTEVRLSSASGGTASRNVRFDGYAGGAGQQKIRSIAPLLAQCSVTHGNTTSPPSLELENFSPLGAAMELH